jgi:hypothetical protein
MSSQAEELALGPKGDEYILIRTDANGIKTEINFSQANVVFSGRLAPTVARCIVASKTRPGCLSVSSRPSPEFWDKFGFV